MIDSNLLKAIAKEFIVNYDSNFLNPVINSTALNNLVTDGIIFSFPDEYQIFTNADAVQVGGQFGGIDVALPQTAGTIGDYFTGGLTRFFPVAETAIYEYLPFSGTDDPDQDRIALRVRQAGTASQTGRSFEQPATYVIEVDEAAVNDLDDATRQALLDGTFDSFSQVAKVVRRVEFYANAYALHAAVLESPFGVPTVPTGDLLTFQPAYQYDPNGDTATAIEIATQVWNSLAVGDLYTPSTLHAADDPNTPENEAAVWSFAITGPSFLPYVGTAAAFTYDGQPLGGVNSAAEWFALLAAGDFATAFGNAGPILGNILAQLGPVIQAGDIQIVDTYAEGNRVLVHLREGETTLPIARETGNPYRAPLELMSWFTIENGKVVSNEVIVNTFATVSALRPEETSPFAYALGNTRHAPPYFLSGSRVNSGIVSYDRDGKFNGIHYETNAFDAPELQLPIGITYGPDGRLYVNSTLGSIDNTPIINAVLIFEGVHGDYPDGTTQRNRASRDRARDAVTANQTPRLQNIDPTRVDNDPSPDNDNDQPNDYNPAIFGNAHGEYYNPTTGDLLDPGSLTVVSFASGLNTAAARPINFATETIRTIIDPGSGAEGYVFADGENPTFAYAVPEGPLGTTPVAILDLTQVPPAPIAILDPIDPTTNNFIDPVDLASGVYTVVYTFDPATNTFTPTDPGGTTLTYNFITDPRIVFNRAGEGSPIGFEPVGLAIPGLVIPSGIKFGPDGNLYLPSAFTSRILQYDGETGEFLSVFATRENGIPVANLLDPAEGLPPDFTVFVFGPDGGIYQSSIRTDINPVTGTFETETYYEGIGGNTITGTTPGPDRTNMDARNGYGAVLRFPGPTWAKVTDPNSPNFGWYIDPLNGNLIQPGQAAGISTIRTDLANLGVFGETGGILSTQEQPLYEPSAVAFGPDLRMYVSSAQTGQVLVYQGPLLPDGTPNPNAGRFDGVYADVGSAVKAETGRVNDILVLSGLGFGPDGNLYVGSSFEQPQDGSENAGAPVAGSQWSVIVGPNPGAFNQEGNPGDYLGVFGDTNTEISRLLLPTTPEFVYYSNSYTHYNDPTERFPEIFYVVGVNTDKPFDANNGGPGFFQDDRADAIAAYDRDMNFLGYLGTPLVEGKLGQDITVGNTNPLSGIGDILLSAGGDILVSSQLTDQVLRYSSLTGQYLGVFVDTDFDNDPNTPGLDFPAGMTISPVNAIDVGDADGLRSGLFVSDLLNGRILKFDGYTGEFFDDPDTADVNEGVLAQLGPDKAGWRFTDLTYGPDGRIYVGLNSPLDNPSLGSAVIQVYNPENNVLEQEITGFDFVAALTFGPDNRLYVSDDPASLVDAEGQPLAPGKESRVVIYEVDYVYPILVDPATGNGSPTGVRSDPTLVTSFNVGVGNAGAINVTLDQATNQPVIFLSEPVSGKVSLYTSDGELRNALSPQLPAAANGIDEDGISRPTGSAFISEFIRPTAYATLSINAPTDLSLSATTVDENVAANTMIGTLSTTDPDAGDTFTYSLVAGTGDTDNTAFSINNNQLLINNSPDFEAKNSYSVRVKTTDQGGLSFEKALVITVNDLNESPTDLSLSSTTVDENVVANTVIGVLTSTDPDTGNTFTYSLVAGTGDTDNTAFSIVNINNDQLLINNSPDFEAKNSYSVRVKTTDQGGLSFEKALTITVNDLNESPTDLSLSATTVDENVIANTVIGTFTSTDPDAGNTFTYSLVAGTGDTDNTAFSINNNQLLINNSPDFEAKNSYSVRVKTTDQGGLSFEKALTITVNDLNESPTDLSLSATTVDENVPANTVIGVLISTAPDTGNTFTYSLVTGTGDTDNTAFSINNNQLLINNSPDFEAKNSYSVRVKTTDQGGLSFEKALTITVNDLNESPTDFSLSSTTVDENVIANTVIGTLTSTDPDAGNTFTYSLVTGTGDTDNTAFSINNNQLLINNSPDFEAKNSYSVRVKTTDQGGLSFEKALTIAVNDLNETSDNQAPTALIFENVVTELTEDTEVTPEFKVADLTIEDDNLGTNNLFLTGRDRDRFLIRDLALYYVGGTLDFETQSNYEVTVNVDDETVGTTPDVAQTFTLNVTDVNEAPTAVTLTNTTTVLPENTDTSQGVKVADIQVTDDALGTNTLSLLGNDQDSFEIRDQELFFIGKADFEAQELYDLTVAVTDTTLNPDPNATPDATVNFTLEITNLSDQPVSPETLQFGDNGQGSLVLDFSSLSGTVQVKADEEGLKQTGAFFNNIVGLYKVADANGAVLDTLDLDGDGNVTELIQPGQAGYARTALSQAVDNFILRASGEGSNSSTTASEFGDVLLEGGQRYAPFVIANGGNLGGGLGSIQAFLAKNPDNLAATLENFMTHEVAYFSFGSANPDGAEHLRQLGDNVFGFEDLPGNLSRISDNDFNDGILAFTFIG